MFYNYDEVKPFPWMSVMTNLPNEKDKLWVKCPPGAIQKVADSSVVTRGVTTAPNLQRRKMLIGTATAAGVAVLAGGAYLATRQSGQRGPVPRGTGVPVAGYNFGGVSCFEVVQVLPAYVGKTIDDPQEIVKIEKHLELCDKCRMIYQSQLES